MGILVGLQVILFNVRGQKGKRKKLSDIDLPYSCQAGMCTACMGKFTEGKVKMDEEDGLTEKEIKQGFVLTCVAHPITAGVVIEID